MDKVPVITPDVITNVKNLSPTMLRYPGGTIAHHWDWYTGLQTSGPGNGIPHGNMLDVAALSYNTGAKITFVLDVLYGNVLDQWNMLKAYNDEMNRLDDPDGNQPDKNYIEYIELGNELYDTDYQNEPGFRTGAQYAASITPWINQIKVKYPDCKIGVSLFPSTIGGNERKDGWNRGSTGNIHLITPSGECGVPGTTGDILTENLEGVLPYFDAHADVKAKIDAFVYHVYIPKPGCQGGTPQSALTRYTDLTDLIAFDEHPDGNPAGIPSGIYGKELWVTEYGDLTGTQDPEQLNILADLLQSNPRITIALNQVLFSGGSSDDPVTMLNSTGTEYSTGGKLFLRRANPIVINKIYNSPLANDEGDAVELLVVQNNLDMENLILKRFAGNGLTDAGVAYRFTNNALWEHVKSGTVIVLSNELSGFVQDVNGAGDTSPFLLHLNVNDPNISQYLTKGTENPNAKLKVTNSTEMWMIKNPNFDSATGAVNTTTNGVKDAIHTLFAGAIPSSSTFYGYDDITGSKLYSSTGCSANATTIYGINQNSALYDYNDLTGASATSDNRLLNSWTSTNQTYIDELRALNW